LDVIDQNNTTLATAAGRRGACGDLRRGQHRGSVDARSYRGL